MAARPNTLRTLEYGKKLVDNQLSRLNDMIAMAEKVLADNKTLTPEDISGYKACIATGKKQITLLARLAEISLPTVTVTTARKRGRPSKSELEQLAAARGEKPAKQPKLTKAELAAATASIAATTTALAAVMPKKRGRKSKATIAAEAAAAAALAAAPAPKKRGRPAKVKTETPGEIVHVTASKVVQGPITKKRGRPAKVKSDETVEVVQSAADAPKRAPRKPKSPTPAINVAPITEGEPVKRGPGRPKGSKNKVTLLNGQNAEVVTA